MFCFKHKIRYIRQILDLPNANRWVWRCKYLYRGSSLFIVDVSQRFSRVFVRKSHPSGKCNCRHCLEVRLTAYILGGLLSKLLSQISTRTYTRLNKRAYFSKVSLSSRLFQCRLFLLYFANTARKRRVNEEEEERKEARRKKKESKETKNTRLRMAFCFTDGLPFKREASSHWLFPLASLYFCLSLSDSRTAAKFANWEPFLSEIRVVRSI